MCIVESIMTKPKNPRELALELDMDYSTIRHSLRVLEKNRIVWVKDKKYGRDLELDDGVVYAHHVCDVDLQEGA